MKNKLAIVALAVLFNLLFEYSMRGVRGFFFHRGIFLFVTPLYAAYFFIIDSLMRRYRVRLRHLLVGAFVLGCFVLGFFSGLAFRPPTVLGINWPVLLFINVLWWGLLQTVLGLYFARRLAGFDPTEPPLGTRSLRRYGGFIVLFHVFTFLVARTAKGTLPALLILVVMILAGLSWLRRSLPCSQRATQGLFEPHRLMDFLAFSSVVVFVLVGTLIARAQQTVPGGFIDLTATRLVTLWTLLVTVGVGLRLFMLRPRLESA